MAKTHDKTKQKVTANTYCADCNKFFTDVRSILTNPTAEKEVETLIEQNLCAMLGAEAQQCDDLVSQYLPLVLSLLSSEVTPQELCQAMGFCNSTVDRKLLINNFAIKAAEARKRQSVMHQFQVAVSADYCGDCKTFFADVKSVLTNPILDSELKTLLEQELCGQLGGLEKTCDELVEQYLPTLVTILSVEFDPAQVCQAMGFCNSSVDARVLMAKLVNKAKVQQQKVQLSKKAELRVGDSASTECVVCEFVMKELDSIIEDNATQSEIIAGLDKVCSVLPATISAECKSFVEQYGPAVILLLESELTPAEICSFIGLCKSVKANLKDAFIATRAASLSSEDCVLCETVIQYVDTLLSSKPTQKEIEQVLDKVCNFLPESLEKDCTTMIDQYAPMIIQIMLQEATPQQVCQYIGLCTNSTKQQVEESLIKPVQAQLVGVNPCTYGPAYWCQTRENAIECKAERHCELHVWN